MFAVSVRVAHIVALGGETKRVQRLALHYRFYTDELEHGLWMIAAGA